MAINAEDLYIRTTDEKDAGANEEDLYMRTTAEKEVDSYNIDLVMGIDIENDIDTILFVAEASISEVGYVTKLEA